MGDAMASWYGRIFAGLEREGRSSPANDPWIAATALRHGLPLFSYDCHFEAADGLARVARRGELLP
jgi:predicted nucleic acid-binding protein